MRTRTLVTAAALALAAIGSSAAFAATATGSSAAAGKAAAQAKGDYPAALKFAQSSGALDVLKSFPAAGGLDGWVVKDKNSGKNLVVYTTKDGEVLLAGMALDKTGQNLTAVYAEAHVPAPDYSSALTDFNTAPSVVVGNPSAKAEITVAFDANCTFCKVMHKLVAPAVDAGELKVRYVPVAILGSDSDVKGAALLAAKNPREIVDRAAQGATFEVSRDTRLLGQVRNNTDLMRKHGFNGTPAVLYKGKKGGEDTVFVSNGVPNIVEMFEKLGISGQVDKLKQDPALARFLR